MKRRFLLLLMFVALFAPWTAQAQFSGGSGTESNPYQISSSTDWNTLASNVNSGTSYSGKYFKMTSNITISGSTQAYMVGTMSGETSSGNAFSGNFNGDGHTITISYSTSSGFYYTAPFRYISGATIKNVKVAGTMNVYKFMGSLVGYCMGTNNIENCVSEVAITGTISGDATMGGLISHVHGGTTYIRGCVFKGKLLGSSSNCVGGFIGWTDHGSAYSEFYDCVFAPSQVTVSTTNSATFSRGNSSNTSGIYVYNSYYTQTHGTTQGQKLQYTITAGNNVSTVALGNNPVEYNLSGITGYNSSSGYGIKYNNTIYAASGNSVKLNLSSTLTNPQYSASAGSLSGTSNPYTLSMTSNNTVISATESGGGGGGGDGDCTEIGTSSGNDYKYGPVNDYYRYGYYQIIYPKDEVPTGDINSIGFNYAYTTAMSKKNNVTIYMGTTSSNTLSDWMNVETMTKVYTGNLNCTQGWNDFTLTTPYSYSGSQNLVVVIMDQSGQYDGSDYKFYYATSSNNVNKYVYTDTQSNIVFPANDTGTPTVNGGTSGNNTYYPVTRFCTTATETCEDFESGSMPSGWTSEGTGSWVVKTGDYASSTGAHGGTYNVSRPHANRNEVCYLVMPAQDFSAVSSATLNFWYINRKWGSDIDYLDVCYRIGNGNWTSLWNTTTNHESWTEQSVNLTGLAANYQIGFKYTDNYGYDVSIDDICIETTGGSTPTYITEIASVEDWDAFCAAVNSGHSYSGETVHLRGPVSITSQDNQQAGASGKYFQGTFEGHGNTITVNMTATGDNCAPFYGLQAATINDLIVTGSISSTYGRAAGISGTIENQDGSVGDCTFNNCISNVAITSSGGTCGGFIGHSGGYTNPTFVGCAFTGSINATAGNNYACFIGFHVSRTGWQTPYICTSHFTNCICAPSSISVNGAESATIVCGYNGGAYLLKEIENSYYNEEAVTLSTKQGTRAYTVTGASPVTVAMAGDATTTYGVSGINVYNPGITLTNNGNTTIYAASGQTLSLTLSGASTYEADHGTLTSSDSNWTLNMEASNTVISAANTCSAPTQWYMPTWSVKGNTAKATLSWGVEAGNTEEWQLCLNDGQQDHYYDVKVDYEDPNITEVSIQDAGTTVFCTLINLTANTIYTAKVRTVCNATEGIYSSCVEGNFTTTPKTFQDNGDFDGQWNNPNNWTPYGVPGVEDVVINEEANISDGVLAKANDITIGENGSITIEDGGQLWHNNNDVELTIKKTITGYGHENASTNLGYQLFSSPVATEAEGEGAGLWSGTYNLYRFDSQAIEEGPLEEWVVETSSIEPFVGYLYANEENTNITITGTVMGSSQSQTEDLVYNEGYRFGGWNLMGNPFVCNAYVSAGNNEEINYYVIEESNGRAEFVPANESNPIAPMGGLMVQATGEGQSITYSRTQPNKGSGILNMSVTKVLSSKGDALLDRARVRFGNGRNLEKFQLNPNHTKIYIPEDGKDYAVVYANGAGTIPVNFKAESNGRYNISFTTEEVGFNYLHLIDNRNGNDVDLLETPYYAFDAQSTDYASRFTLVFATGHNDGDDTFAFFNNGVWIINNPSTGSGAEATLQVVDVMGRVLSSETISGSCSKAINAAPGVYMLRLINGNDVKVQKVVVR